ncbi:exodeoxyribonuclease VII large subunit [Bengtsoniella intestinalis]|uniref:exodeoxyribonuclease VII large subunit n=1 Tax=Bengtsoniella intestinalis TaxID=3073143 RepID=UPI00391F433F
MKDQDGALRSVMFKGSATKLRFQPQNGMKVIASGRIAVFPRDGAYQLYCTSLSPDGIGDLYVAFEQLKEKLYQEGLFDQQYKKPLPAYPQTIAIITSSAGAAVHDMIRILRSRYPIAKVKLLPVRVQGVEAPAEIAGAIRFANRHQLADVIITGRGGGSMEDLWAFNDERVARAIFASDLPVISAVGHEPDVTIADFVADARASTPSNAAEIVVPDQGELLRNLQSMGGSLNYLQSQRIEQLRLQWDKLATSRVLVNQMAYVEDKSMMLSYLQQRFGDVSANILGRKQQSLAVLASSLDAMSPLKVLGRGYAMVQTKGGVIVKNCGDVAVGDQINVTVGDGILHCQVSEKETIQ